MDYYPFGAPMPQRWQDVEPYDTVTNNSLDSNLLSTWTLMNEQKPTADSSAFDTTLVSASKWSAYATLSSSTQVIDSPDKSYTAEHTGSEPEWFLGESNIEMILYGDGYESFRINYLLDTFSLPGLEVGDSISVSYRVAFNNYDQNHRMLIEDASGGGAPAIEETITIPASGDLQYQIVTHSFIASSIKMNIGILSDYSSTSGAGSTNGWHKNAIVMRDWKLQHYKAEEYGEIVVNSNTFLKKPHYRFGFNGMERDDEVKGSGNQYMTEFRLYDARLGRWFSTDPLKVLFPSQSPYSAFNNSPVYFRDPTGLSGEGPKHTVEQDETLTSIAKDYSTTVDDIIRANTDVDWGSERRHGDQNWVFAGETLNIPGTASETAQSGKDESRDNQVITVPDKINLSSENDIEQILEVFRFVEMKSWPGNANMIGFSDEPNIPIPIEELIATPNAQKARENGWKTQSMINGSPWFYKTTSLVAMEKNVSMKVQIMIYENYADIHDVGSIAQPITDKVKDGYYYGLSLRGQKNVIGCPHGCDMILLRFESENDKRRVINDYLRN